MLTTTRPSPHPAVLPRHGHTYRDRATGEVAVVVTAGPTSVCFYDVQAIRRWSTIDAFYDKYVHEDIYAGAAGGKGRCDGGGERATHDAPRISKLPGTLARKGPDIPARPGWPEEPEEKTNGTLETPEPCLPKSNQGNTYNRVPNYEGVRDTESVFQSSRVSVSQEGGEVELSPRDIAMTSALLWLSGVMTREPVPKDQLYDLGNTLLMDSPALDHAAVVLNVERTIENGIEMWNLP